MPRSRRLPFNRDELPAWKLLRIGHLLAQEFFLDEALPVDGGWIRLVPEWARRHFADNPYLDGFARTVPWLLLARQIGNEKFEFLARAKRHLRWIVTPASAGQRPVQIRFPGAPRLLLAMPNPELIVPPGAGGRKHEQLPDTGARDHVDELEQELLQGLYPAPCEEECSNGKHSGIRKAFTWREFRDALNRPPYPEAIYFFGHGKYYPRQGTHLAFAREASPAADTNGGARGWGTYVSLTAIAGQLAALVERGHRPFLFFVNCCQGDAGQQEGVGAVLANMSAATISNRSFIPPDDARVIGRGILLRVVNEGLPPHLALLDLYERDITALGDLEDGARWAVPTLYANYESWVPQSLSERASTYRDAVRSVYYSRSIPERVGRDLALREAREAVRALLATDNPGLRVLFWRAPPRQGLMPFSDRLHDEFREVFPDDDFSHILVELQAAEQPAHNEVLQVSFEKAIGRALDQDMQPDNETFVPDPTELLQKRLPSAPKQKDLLLVTHRAIDTNDVGFLHKYLLFWQSLFDNASHGRRGRVVLAIPVLCTTLNDPWNPPVPNSTTDVRWPMVPVDITPAFGPLNLEEIVTHAALSRTVPHHAAEPGRITGSRDSETISGGAFDDVVVRLRIALGIQA
jgi:hypothetical protein